MPALFQINFQGGLTPHPPLMRSPFPSRGRLKLMTLLKNSLKLQLRSVISLPLRGGEITENRFLEIPLKSLGGAMMKNNAAEMVVYGKIFTSEGNQIVEAFAVKDTVPVPLKFRAEGAGRHGPVPALGVGAAYGIGRQVLSLPHFQFFPDGHSGRHLPAVVIYNGTRRKSFRCFPFCVFFAVSVRKNGPVRAGPPFCES